MTANYMDVDTWVYEALEKGDFEFAKAVVIEHSGSISIADRDQLLRTIAEAKERKLQLSTD